MAGITVEVQDAQLTARIADLQSGIADASPLMRVWGEIAQQSIDENFDVGGRPQHWQPLAAATINKRIKGRTNLTRLATKNLQSRNPFKVTFLRPLVGTGTLKKVTVKPAKNTVEIGSNPSAKAYAAIHQFGGQAGRGRKVTIPARPYILLQTEDEQEMRQEALIYLRKIAS